MVQCKVTRTPKLLDKRQGSAVKDNNVFYKVRNNKENRQKSKTN